MANKVKYGLKNIYYAKKTDDGYETPIALNGAVSLSLDAEGDINSFYADNRVYYQQAVNGGYSGSLEIAMITDEFRTKILGEQVDANGVYVESNGDKIAEFALAFEIDGDVNANRYWFTSCTVSRPSTEASTTEDTLTPQTDTLDIQMAADANGVVRFKAGADSSAYATWFNQVYTKAE